MVVECIGDSVTIGELTLSKEAILTIAVVFDFIGVLIMIHFFTKLEKFNNEFLKIYNDNNLTMRDFAI